MNHHGRMATTSALLLALGVFLSAALAGCIGNVENASWPLHASYEGTDYRELHLAGGTFGDVEVHGCGCSFANADVFLRSLLSRAAEAEVMARSSLVFQVDGTSLGLQLELGGLSSNAEALQFNRLAVQLPAATPVRVEGNLGDVVVDGMTGPVDISLTSGNVQAQASSGRVEVESGDIDFVWTPSPGQSLQLTATSGDIHVQVPPGHGFTYEIAVSSGDVQVVGVDPTGKGLQQGQVGDGSAKLFVSATSGDIRID